MHGHGQGMRLGTCLVQRQCVSYVVASAACVTADKCSVLLMMTQCWLCTVMDEACALVLALCNSSVSRVSLLSSMFHCFHFLVGRGHAEACGLAHDHCTPRVAWPLLQASPVLDGVAQRCCMHTNSALVRYEIIIFCCK